MTALTKDRSTTTRRGLTYHDPMAAATKIYAGSIVCLDAAGNAVPGSTATTLTARGIAQEQIDNSAGGAGDKAIRMEPGTGLFANDGSIARVDIGGTAYIVDDQTVADTDGGATRSAAGKIVDVDSDGVWVQIG